MKSNLKFFASILLSIAVLMTAIIPVGAVSDINGHWAQDIIEKWLEAEKIRGYEDGTFRPDGNVTRAEFATILANLTDDMVNEVEHKFEDVKPDDWYYEYVMKLLGKSVIDATEKFYPNEYITREDVMSMAGKAFFVMDFSEDTLKDVPDADEISEDAVPYVAGFVDMGYVKGYEDGSIRPKNPITRAESIKILDGLDLVYSPNSMKGILDRVYLGVKSELPPTAFFEINADNVEYYLGIKSFEKVEEAWASEALRMPTAHSVCLVKVKENVDAEALRLEIQNSADPMKWICTGVDPEQVVTVRRDNLILLAMTLEASQEIADSFMALEIEEEKSEVTKTEDGLYLTDGYYMDDIGEIRPVSVENFAKKVENLIEKYLKNSNNIYYSVVPSKSFFVNDSIEKSFDYKEMEKILAENIKSAKYINLFDTLTLTDYYRTDPHWKQEGMQKVLDRLGENLGFEIKLDGFTKNVVENFVGQHGYKKENFPSESLDYFTNDAIDNAKVSHEGIEGGDKLYDMDKLNSASPYDMFLSGPSPIVTIENGNAKTDKELVIFRDSFACNLAPLLVEEYKTITLIDIRYTMSQILGQYVNFDGKDVLFLYNEQVINFSEMLK